MPDFLHRIYNSSKLRRSPLVNTHHMVLNLHSDVLYYREKVLSRVGVVAFECCSSRFLSVSVSETTLKIKAIFEFRPEA